MARISSTLASLINGVSQQPPAERLPNQCELQENFDSSVIDGLKRRNPSQHIAVLDAGGVTASTFIHTIDRGPGEQYEVLISNGSLRVFDITGTERTVNFPHGTAYLNVSGDPVTSFRAVSTKDWTLIGNSEVTIGTQTGTDEIAGFGTNKLWAINIVQGEYNASYKVACSFSHSGVTHSFAAQYTTSASDPTTIDTSYIATQLYSGLASSFSAPGCIFQVTHNENVVVVSAITGSPGVAGYDSTLGISDSLGDTLMTVTQDYGSAQLISDLPLFLTYTAGTFKVKIVGSEGSDLGYWVSATRDNDLGVTQNDRVVWVESSPVLGYGPDPATAPWQLTKNNDGTFTFDRAAYENRLVGDAKSAPLPTFIGQKLDDLFVFKNRLGILANGHLTLSRPLEFFSFFPTTVTTILDTNPIDVQATDPTALNLHAAVPFNDDLWIFADKAQFRFTGSPTLTTKTASIQRNTGFASSASCRPVQSGKNIYFAADVGAFSVLSEYFVDVQNFSYDAASITKHVSKYIPSSAIKIAVSPAEDVMTVISNGDRATLYVYKFYWDGDTKVQSSWSKYLFDSGCVIHGAEFIGSTLYLVVNRPGSGLMLEKMNFNASLVDAGINYVTRLDRRITEAQATASYNATTDVTTWTLPYIIATGATYAAVLRADSGGLKQSQRLTLTSTSGNAITAKGDQRSLLLYMGQTYKSKYRFSKIYLRRRSTPADPNIVDNSGSLKMRTWKILFSDTGYFEAQVTPDNGQTWTYQFTGQNVRGPSILGIPSIQSGSFVIPIMARNDRVTVDIISDSHLPCAFNTLDWEAEYFTRSQRI